MDWKNVDYPIGQKRVRYQLDLIIILVFEFVLKTYSEKKVTSLGRLVGNISRILKDETPEFESREIRSEKDVIYCATRACMYYHRVLSKPVHKDSAEKPLPSAIFEYFEHAP